jgi:prolipoprotein diacylglyceryl transferase
MIFVNDLSPEIFNYGFVHIRWYGLLFLIGVVLSYLITRWAFKKNKFSFEDLDSIALYLFIGLIVGARLGEILFYDPVYYLQNPSQLLAVWNGGLSSHGATIGLVFAFLIWTFIHKIGFAKYADLFALGMPVAAMFVRIGNFFNSEIYGTRTDGSFGVIFAKLGEDFPRHPAQLYEAGLLFVIFVVLFFVYKIYSKKLPSLFITFSFIFLYFTGRFFIEFVKDLHGLPADFPLSTGQVLSILPILFAVVYFITLICRRRHCLKN